MADAIKNFPARLYKMTETFCHEVQMCIRDSVIIGDLENNGIRLTNSAYRTMYDEYKLSLIHS